MKTTAAFILALLLALPCLSAAELDATLVSIEGDERPVKILELTLDGVRTADGDIAYKDIAELRFSTPAPETGKALIHLRNGDTLRADVKGGDDAKLTVLSEAVGELQIPFKFFRAVSFPLKEGPPAEGVADFLAGPTPKEDLLLTQKGDTVRGVYEKVSGTELHFNAGGQSRGYAFDTIAAFRLAPLEDFKATKDFRGTVLLRDGSKLTGKLQNLKAGKLSFESLTGEAWTVETSAVASVQFEGGKLQYLTDLKPQSVEERAYIGGALFIHRWRKDRAADGQKLKIGSREYSRGIGTHSYSKLVFELGGQYLRLLCDTGLAAHAPASANVEWKIVVDGKTAQSGTAQAGAEPQTIKLDVAGAKQLELICDFGSDQDDAGDLFNWAGARLIRQ